MDLIETIKSRRSVRKFGPDPVPPELIEKVLEAGRWAPSGLNNQPWRFAVITNHRTISEISTLTHYSKVVLASRVLIPVFLDTEKSYHREKDIQAIGACLQNMLLEIHSLGLGAVWLGEIIKSDREIRELLGLTGSLELMAVLALGYPDEQPKATKRKELKDLVVFKN
ncbi:MAG: nitroreductase family protein [Thermodesulfovibrio sp.]|nr:nitroreductase family protein [Thermodesulfovibrio sp.]